MHASRRACRRLAAVVASTRPHNSSLDASLPADVAALPHLAVALDAEGSLGLSSDPAVTTDEALLGKLQARMRVCVRTRALARTAAQAEVPPRAVPVQAAEKAELQRYAAFGGLAETKASS